MTPFEDRPDTSTRTGHEAPDAPPDRAAGLTGGTTAQRASPPAASRSSVRCAFQRALAAPARTWRKLLGLLALPLGIGLTGGCNERAEASNNPPHVKPNPAPSYVTQGGDWGSVVADVMTEQKPAGPLGIHVNMPATVPPDVVNYFNDVDKAGHFAAWAQPELFAADFRVAVEPLR